MCACKGFGKCSMWADMPFPMKVKRDDPEGPWCDRLPYRAGDSMTRNTHRCYSIHWPGNFYKCTVWCWEH